MLLARPGLRIWIADEGGKVKLITTLNFFLIINIALLGPQYCGFQGSTLLTAFTSSSCPLGVYFTCQFLSFVAVFHSTFNVRWKVHSFPS